MTVISKSRFRQTVYELVENDDSILRPPRIGTAVVDALTEAFLKGALSVYYDPEANSLCWQEVKRGRTSETVDASISILKRDVELDPSSMRAHNDLGVAYAKKGFWDQAIKEFNKAIELNPNFGPAHTNLGVAYGEKGLVDKAMMEHKLATELNPKDGEAHVNLGYSYLDKGLIDKAIAEYKLALKLNPSLIFACDGLGNAYALKGLLNKAISWFKRAVEFDPNSAVAHRNLGRAYNDKELIDDAIKEFKRAIELDPDDAKAHNDLGVAYAKKGFWDQAIAEYKRAIELDLNSAATHNNLGAAYAKSGSPDQAIAEFERAIKKDPNLESARKNLEIMCQSGALQSEPVLEDDATLIRPDDPFKNRLLYQRMISGCEEFLYWIDKYFSQAGFSFLFDSIDSMRPPRIRQIRILMSIRNVDEKFRNLFKDFAESMKKRGVKTELRVIDNPKLEKSIHDRWILSRIKNFNIPSPDIVARGQWSEVKETKNRPPFEEWWNSSKDIIEDWNSIRKFKTKFSKG
jgi:tetratricopeptide (TPR) repeat protein